MLFLFSICLSVLIGRCDSFYCEFGVSMSFDHHRHSPFRPYRIPQHSVLGSNVTSGSVVGYHGTRGFGGRTQATASTVDQRVQGLQGIEATEARAAIGGVTGSTSAAANSTVATGDVFGPIPNTFGYYGSVGSMVVDNPGEFYFPRCLQAGRSGASLLQGQQGVQQELQQVPMQQQQLQQLQQSQQLPQQQQQRQRNFHQGFVENMQQATNVQRNGSTGLTAVYSYAALGLQQQHVQQQLEVDFQKLEQDLLQHLPQSQQSTQPAQSFQNHSGAGQNRSQNNRPQHTTQAQVQAQVQPQASGSGQQPQAISTEEVTQQSFESLIGCVFKWCPFCFKQEQRTVLFKDGKAFRKHMIEKHGEQEEWRLSEERKKALIRPNKSTRYYFKCPACNAPHSRMDVAVAHFCVTCTKYDKKEQFWWVLPVNRNRKIPYLYKCNVDTCGQTFNIWFNASQHVKAQHTAEQ